MHAFSKCILPTREQFRMMILLFEDRKAVYFHGQSIYKNRRCFNRACGMICRAGWIEKVNIRNGRNYHNVYKLSIEGELIVRTVLNEYAKANA